MRPAPQYSELGGAANVVGYPIPDVSPQHQNQHPRSGIGPSCGLLFTTWNHKSLKALGFPAKTCYQNCRSSWLFRMLFDSILEFSNIHHPQVTFTLWDGPFSQPLRKDSKPKERRAEFEMAAVLGPEPQRLLTSVLILAYTGCLKMMSTLNPPVYHHLS